MNRERATSIMASFATIKSLSQEKIYQNAYQLLSEFILHIIRQESLSCFQATEMKRYLLQYFGFIIPEAVVKTTSKRMAGITRDKGMYSVDFSVIGNDSFFTDKQQAADKTNTSIIKALVEYISVRKKEEINEEKLTKELVDILLNEQHAKNGEYSVLISEFILKNEKNKEIQEGLNNIREGSILYLGLNYNIGETGSIKKPLTLYLGTEILFSLVGYNGLIYKQLAEDFFSLVRAANNNGQRNIVLRYFDDVKQRSRITFIMQNKLQIRKKCRPCIAFCGAGRPLVRWPTAARRW